MSGQAELAARYVAPIFDPLFYIAAYQFDGIGPEQAFAHFIEIGSEAGAAPSPLFDPGYYETAHGLSGSVADLVCHFVEFGLAEGLDPSPIVDRRHYAGAAGLSPDTDPIRHYLAQLGGSATPPISPSPFFDPGFYGRVYPDVVRVGMDPLLHYLTYGWREDRSPSPYFSTRWYLSRYPDVAKLRQEPLAHFLTVGFGQGRRPHHLIDLDFYLDHAPDVRAARMHPWPHFVLFGDAETRSPHPLFNAHLYRALMPAGESRSPFAHYVEIGANALLSPCAFFDAVHYSWHYPDLSLGGNDPILDLYLAAPGSRRHVHPLIDLMFLHTRAEPTEDADRLAAYVAERQIPSGR